MLTIASYNIHSAIGRDGRCDPDRILNVIRATNAHIAGLQEVDARPRRVQPFDQFDYLEANSGMTSIAGPNIVEHRGKYGNALLSSLPVEDVELVRLPSGRSEPRGAIVATVRHGTQRLQVVNTHFGLGRTQRLHQARALLDIVDRKDGPLVFIGDFNSWGRKSAALKLLGAPSEKTLAPASFPARRPVLPLDRIWTRPAELLQKVVTVRDQQSRIASDHLPLVATIDL